VCYKMGKFNRKLIFFPCLLTVLIFFSTGIHADENSQLKKIRQALNRIKPFKVRFVQEVFTDNTIEADIRESGEIIFKNDTSLKWTYLEPDYKVFLLEDDDYRFYDEDNEQLIVGKIKDRSQQWVWQVLFADDLTRHSRISWDNEHRTLKIKNDPQGFSGESGKIGDVDIDIEVTINEDFFPVKVVQLDPSGARILYHFNKYTPHVKINDDTFRLKIPEGVEIIREES